MDDTGDVAAQRQEDVEPELQAETDLQKYAERRQDDCQQNTDDVQGRLVKSKLEVGQ
jgi:hypothetical protein